MQNNFAKTYLYTLLIISAINLVLGLAYIATKITALEIPLIFFSYAEIIAFIMSIMMIVKVFTKKLNRINLILPVFYILLAIALIIYGLIAGPITDDLGIMESFIVTFNLLSFNNLLLLIINSVANVFQIIFSIYLLKTNNSFRQEQ